MPERHSLPTVLYTGLSGSSPVSVTGSPDRCRSLSSTQTPSDIWVRAELLRPVDGSAMTKKHSSWVNNYVSGSKKRANSRMPPRVLREASLYASSSPFKSRVAPSRYRLSRSDFQVARFTEISLGVRWPVFCCPQRGEYSIAYGSYYMPSLAYSMPASSLTTKECEDIQRPVVAAILPKMGIVRNAARAVVFRPSQYCGLGLDHIAAVQGHNRIQYLIGHIRSKSLTGKLIRNQLDYTQLEVCPMHLVTVK
jgi:hypothetical protein